MVGCIAATVGARMVAGMIEPMRWQVRSDPAPVFIRYPVAQTPLFEAMLPTVSVSDCAGMHGPITMYLALFADALDDKDKEEALIGVIAIHSPKKKPDHMLFQVSPSPLPACFPGFRKAYKFLRRSTGCFGGPPYIFDK